MGGAYCTVSNIEFSDYVKFCHPAYIWTRSTTAILVAIVYGKTLVENDPYIQLSQKLAISMSNGGSCGATTIDIFPWYDSCLYQA